MSIEITAAEYFEQLLLMEQQYGQEEDLYPWIYMLLQMMENKRQLVDKSYKGVSIRYIAGGSKADTVIGRNQISAFGVFPDIAILDKDFIAISTKGGIERKQLEEIKGIDGIVKYLEHPKRKGAKRITIPELEINNKIRKFCFENNMNKIYGCIEAKPINAELKELNEDLSSYTYESIIGSKGLNTIGELIFELMWYGKVIYTNGLEWRCLELTGISCCENFRKELFDKINKIGCGEGEKKKLEEKFNVLNEYIKNHPELRVICNKIADLRKCYNHYKRVVKGNEEKINDFVSIEWDNLINGLSAIQWLTQPEQTKED